MELVFCIDCGKQLGKYAYYYKNKRCIKCSNTGKNNAMYGVHRFGKDAPAYKDGRCLNKYCIDCNKKITSGSKSGRCSSCSKKGNLNPAIVGHRDNQHKLNCHCFCCKAKRGEYKGKNNPNFGKDFSGLKNANWRGGISKLPYAFEFNDELKEQIRKRDNYECQKCGITEENHLILRGNFLTVHHIDYDKMNCKEDNLITLCNSCNGNVNGDRVKWTKYFQDKIIDLIGVN